MKSSLSRSCADEAPDTPPNAISNVSINRAIAHPFVPRLSISFTSTRVHTYFAIFQPSIDFTATQSVVASVFFAPAKQRISIIAEICIEMPCKQDLGIARHASFAYLPFDRKITGKVRRGAAAYSPSPNLPSISARRASMAATSSSPSTSI